LTAKLSTKSAINFDHVVVKLYIPLAPLLLGQIIRMPEEKLAEYLRLKISIGLTVTLPAE
jgi:hypothetical protein